MTNVLILPSGGLYNLLSDFLFLLRFNIQGVKLLNVVTLKQKDIFMSL